MRRSAPSGLVVLGALLASVAGPISPAVAATPDRRPAVSAWLPYWDAPAANAFVADASRYDEILPFWYELRAGGVVRAYDGAEDARVLEAARAAGVRVLPTVTNDFDPDRVHVMLATDAGLDAHVAALRTLAQPFDGLDIDYEGLYAGDRGRFTLFTQRLAAALHADGKLLSMTLHPKTSEPGTWDGPRAQDWAAIGGVADRVRVMAYDEHWQTSTAGPIASGAWVTAVADFAAATIDPAKVHLGAPLYGYDWVGSAGEGLVWRDAEARRLAAGAALRRSTDGNEPWFTYVDAGRTHTVWYSDARSTATKLGIVDAAGLAGITFWRLGGEDPAVWPLVERWASGSVIDLDAPTPVRKLSATPGSRAIRLRWIRSEDAAPVRYRIFRSWSAKGTLKRIAVVDASWFTQRRVRPGARFWYAVQPIDQAGNAGRISGRVSARAAA